MEVHTASRKDARGPAHAGGGSGIAEASALGPAWRDLHAVNMHGLLNLQTNLEMYGRIVLGLKPNTPLI